jgi:glycosyltransferase involved in cell wall biosynthesis
MLKPLTHAPVSVVIPAHNAERFLEAAIRSVKAQNLNVTETIVVADDCLDRTAQIAEDLGTTVIRQKRRNMAAGLNLGIKISTQPWIALMDADDLWEKDKIALQWKAVEACPDAGIVSCDVLTLMGQQVTSRSRRHLRERWRGVSYTPAWPGCRYVEKIDGGFFTRFSMTTSTVLLRRDLFSEIGYFDESLLFGQTFEFFARALARYGLAFVERPLIYQRVHERNHTRNLAAYWPTYISIVSRMLKHPELYPKDAGLAHREDLKRKFHVTEWSVARQKANHDG